MAKKKEIIEEVAETPLNVDELKTKLETLGGAITPVIVGFQSSADAALKIITAREGVLFFLVEKEDNAEKLQEAGLHCSTLLSLLDEAKQSLDKLVEFSNK